MSDTVKSADTSVTAYMDVEGGPDGLIQMTPSLSSGVEKNIYDFYANFAESHPKTATYIWQQFMEATPNGQMVK
nr:hypothetical protein [Desulforamulus aquiferis]